MTRPRVVVTGVGPITAVGIGRDAFLAGLRRAESAVRPIDRFDASPFGSRIAAQIDDFEAREFIDPRRARRLERFGQFAVASASLALADASLTAAEIEGDRAAVQMGSALGGLAHAQTQFATFLDHGIRAVDPRVATSVFSGAASCEVAIEFGLHGPNSTNAMSCASGTIAIGEAFRLLRDGMADVAIAGGVEVPLGPLSFGAFALIRALSARNDAPHRACRPFDRDRDGFVMGEGAAALVLETLGHARARGAHIYAEVAGYGVTNDGHSMVAPRPEGTQAAAAMRAAMRMADLAPGDVAVINAHASSTPLNDATESRVIREVLGPVADDVAVIGTKPYHGHPLGASGAIEAVVSCLAFESGWLPPILNLDAPGAGCDLDYVTGSGRICAPGVTLSNSFGFGGINACLVLVPGSALAREGC
ncbi:MAG: beta-ketoacyl-[acyl-carrier-protein] synthase family protein [Longimicrobiales bacterium]|nr:beta-ketoacyl-[acyl-carrier-protein] synthase family protein [Longimicrobiales bacterium]